MGKNRQTSHEAKFPPLTRKVFISELRHFFEKFYTYRIPLWTSMMWFMCSLENLSSPNISLQRLHLLEVDSTNIAPPTSITKMKSMLKQFLTIFDHEKHLSFPGARQFFVKLLLTYQWIWLQISNQLQHLPKCLRLHHHISIQKKCFEANLPLHMALSLLQYLCPDVKWNLASRIHFQTKLNIV